MKIWRACRGRFAQHLAAFEAAHRQMMQEAIFRPLPTRDSMNYYQMFGISPDASAEEIERAYVRTR